MPRKGKTITVEDAGHRKLAKSAEEAHRTIPGYIAALVDLAEQVEREKAAEVPA